MQDDFLSYVFFRREASLFNWPDSQESGYFFRHNPAMVLK